MSKTLRPDFSRETAHGGIVAGVDEAGRGPLAGPVVAAAVILSQKGIPRGLNDSKQLPSDKREALYAKILARHTVGVGLANVEEIDTLNILGATKLAMLRAIHALPALPELALVDGNQPPKLPCAVMCVIEGDAKCLSIAAASIVAKVTRDRIMQRLALDHPEYGFDTNAGYGTRQHCEALKRHGALIHHRRSFAPVREVLALRQDAA